ncbi:MAG TPA: TIM barrel protein [Phycisphaerales bacterium]|nr:TIM barrel protein [Phycisphaerales bacterium]
MLLTLTLTPKTPIKSLTRGGLLEAPRMVREQYGLSGLNIATSLLKGADRPALIALRDAADRAGCACLVLVEPAPLALASARAQQVDQALARTARLVEAASLLGCNSLALGVQGDSGDEAFERAVDALREVAAAAEKRELNVLISPTDGLTAEPERVTELIKRVGGFRIGTYPDFETASKAEDPVAYLRRLAPYAWAVSAATREFVDLGDDTPPPAHPPRPQASEDDGDEPMDEVDEEPLIAAPEHVPYDLDAMVGAVASVGYDGTLAIDYRGDAGTLGLEQSCAALDAALARLAGG